MSSSTFQRLANLIKKWPIDETKAGRDFGQYLRDSIRAANEKNKFTPENQAYWDRQYLALQKLINNEHSKRYSRKLSTSATGLNAEQCTLAVSNDFLQQLEEEEKSAFRKLNIFGKNKKKE